MPKAVIACDLGTGSVKSTLFRASGECATEIVVPYPTFYPAPNYHEQRPTDWWRCVLHSIRSLVAAAGDEAEDVAAVALSGHSLGCTPLSASARLLQEQVPIWSDRRAEAEAEEFFRSFDRNRWYHTTGNGFPAPLYPTFKAMWLRRHRPEVFAETRWIVGPKDYVNYKLTGVLSTDRSYASGSGAYDLRTGDYSDEILTAAGLSRTLLPPIVESTAIIGEVLPDVAAELGLPSHVKVVSGGVDNSCMALGARAYREGDNYCSMGSSSWLTVCSKAPIIDDRVVPFVFAHVVPGFFISATSIFSSGTSLKWVRDLLAEPRPASVSDGQDGFDALIRRSLQSPPGARGLLFVPTLGGGTSLEGGPSVRGAFLGLDLVHRREDLIRATLEGIAMALGIAFGELRQITNLRDEMIVVGGGARSAIWRGIMANALGCVIVKTAVDQQAAALGAAALGFVGTGEWRNFDRISELHVVQDRQVPDSGVAAVWDAALSAYRVAARQQQELAAALETLRRASSSREGEGELSGAPGGG